MFNVRLDIHKVCMEVCNAVLDTRKVCKGGGGADVNAVLDTRKVCFTWCLPKAKGTDNMIRVSGGHEKATMSQ
jgi:hypothetical protein